MAPLMSFVWIIIGYCVFAYKFGEEKLGASITKTSFFFLYPVGFVIFISIVNMFSNPQVIVAGVLITFLVFFMLITMFKELNDPALLCGTGSAIASYAFFSNLAFRTYDFVGVFLVCAVVFPFLMSISVTYLCMRRYIRSKKNSNNTEAIERAEE